MPVSAEAILQDESGRAVLRFERRLSHSPERVWNALIERDELVKWHPTPFELESEVAGAVEYFTVENSPEMPVGAVTEYDPPRVLAHTWGEDLLRWEIEPRDDGCVLVLTQTFDDRFKAARDAAGWDLCLDALTSALEGSPAPHRRDDEGRIPGGWEELNRAYQERFGISPEEATPPPEM